MNIASNLKETSQCHTVKAPVCLATTRDIIPDTSPVTTHKRGKAF